MSDWQPIETAPKDRPILVCDADSDIYITAWTEDVYTHQGGNGGPSGWFSGRYRDRWGDYPEFDYPVKWQELPLP